jgi:hypothetical protein
MVLRVFRICLFYMGDFYNRGALAAIFVIVFIYHMGCTEY